MYSSSFNNSILQAKQKALFKALVNFYTYEDEGEKKIIMGKYNLANPHEKLIDLFHRRVVHIYNKSEDNIGIGLYQDGYHPFQGLTFEDYGMLGNNIQPKSPFLNTKSN